jgi:hypothetical protein
MDKLKFQKLLLLLIILGILLLQIISQNQKPTAMGTIEKITISNNKIKIKIKNEYRDLVLFEESIPNLENGQKIMAYGKIRTYKNKQQILVDKIILIS